MNMEFIKDKLKVGDIFPNRKALCEHLEETYTNQTNSKKAQDRIWRKYFEFEKIQGTQKIEITEIYEQEKLDFSSKGSPMPEVIDPAVLAYLKKMYTEALGKCYFTLSGIAEGIGMCSQKVTKFYSSDIIYYELKKKYSSSSNNKDNESKLFKIMAGYIYKVSSSYKSMIGGALDRLVKKHLITVERVILIKSDKLNSKICQLIDEEKYEEIKELVVPSLYSKIQDNIISKDERNEPYFKEGELHKIGITDDELREASPDEKHFIETVNMDVAKEYGCDTIQKLHRENARNPGIRKNYYNECKKRCEEFNIDSFVAYRLDRCNYSVSQLDMELNDLARIVNLKFIEHFRASVKTKSEKNINDKHMEKLLKHNEDGLGKMRDERVEEMQGVEKNLAQFIEDFLQS